MAFFNQQGLHIRDIQFLLTILVIIFCSVPIIFAGMLKRFDKLRDVTLCYPENDKKPFFDMLSGKLTRIAVRIDLLSVSEEQHGDYVNDKNFKRSFQQWLNHLWLEKDGQID